MNVSYVVAAGTIDDFVARTLETKAALVDVVVEGAMLPSDVLSSLEELVAGVERGILIHGDGSYSIDQQRYNFQFGGQTFREIVKGKVGGMLRDVVVNEVPTLMRPGQFSALTLLAACAIYLALVRQAALTPTEAAWISVGAFFVAPDSTASGTFEG